MEEKTNQEKQPTNQTSRTPRVSGPVSAMAGRLAGGSTHPELPADDPAIALLLSLPAPWNLGRTAITQLAGRVADLLAAGWTRDQLATEWTFRSAENPPGALRHRINDTAPFPPPTATTAPATHASRLPACPICRADEGAGVSVRMIGGGDEGPARRCPCVTGEQMRVSA